MRVEFRVVFFTVALEALLAVGGQTACESPYWCEVMGLTRLANADGAV